jgi:hypothetical protein
LADVPKVLNAQHLLYEAQIGHHYGLDEDLAIASLTSVPAKALGLDHRIGYARVGYDADIVLWDFHPLALGAAPIQVFVDGIQLFDEKSAEKKLGKKVEIQQPPSQRPYNETEALNPDIRVNNLAKADFVATGIKQAYIRGGTDLDSITATSEGLTMVVRDGQITCLASTCPEEMEAAVNRGVQLRHLENGYVLPGLTLLSPSHGLVEIEAEKSTRDGILDNSKNPAESGNVIYAKDGLTFDGKHLERAHEAGILNLITAPLSRGFLDGVSVAFKSGGKNVLEKGAVIQEEVAVHFSIGHDSNGGNTPSISSQIALLRKILTDASNVTDTLYGRAANGKIPLAITTQNKDVIAHLLKMKAEISDMAPINLVIIGGIESYLLAEDLAQAKVPVILVPWRCQPQSWESRHCLPGPPISEKTSFQILVEHGVDVALGAWDDGLVTTLYWEAGWAAKGTELRERDVVGLISTKVEEILGIKWENHEQGGHVLFEGNPLDFGANVVAII